MTDLPTLAFLDTETTGLDMHDDVWDFAVILRQPGQPDVEHQMFVAHNVVKAARLPEPFWSDYSRRFQADAAWPKSRLCEWLRDNLTGAVIIGAVPSFDTTRLEILMRKTETIRTGWSPPWHYQVIDVETLALGNLTGYNEGAAVYFDPHGTADPHEPFVIPVPPWDSDALTAMVGVESTHRHTALGDARWARATFDQVNPWPQYERVHPAVYLPG